MKKIGLLIVFTLCVRILSFSEAVSLTINCETPGQLSRLMTESEKESVVNLTVTGLINKTDLSFIKNLIDLYSLHGFIDLENTILNVTDNNMPGNCLSTNGKSIQKFVFPKSVVSVPDNCFGQTKVDTVVWTNTEVDDLNLRYIAQNFLILPEGLLSIYLDNDNYKLILPSTITYIEGCFPSRSNLTVFSNLKNPQAIYARSQTYLGSDHGHVESAVVNNSTFYIPKGTMAKYLRSDFATMYVWYQNGNFWTTKPANNSFIEYYDVDSTLCDKEIIIYKGDTAVIQTQIFPDANLVSWINYTSSNPEIVSVNSQGLVSGDEYGEANITVTPQLLIEGLETKSDTCHVRVISHPEGITTDSAITVHIGEFKQLYARTLPLDITDDNIIYSCNDTSIATVSSEGLVQGISRGSCVITATSVDGGFSAQCVVTVILAVEAVMMETHELSLNVNQCETLQAYTLPLNADNKSIHWTSTDSEVAEVDNDGNVIAKKPGIAFIKATSEDNPLAVDSCKVIVIQPVTGIMLNSQNCELYAIGETYQLVATVLPENAFNKEVKWTSSDESVSIVSSGTVEAVGYGNCVIIATTVDGNYTATCTVKVVDGSFLPGDADGDGKISIADVVAIIDYILGNTEGEFYEDAADVTGNGDVNIADAVELIDILLAGGN